MALCGGVNGLWHSIRTRLDTQYTGRPEEEGVVSWNSVLFPPPHKQLILFDGYEEADRETKGLFLIEKKKKQIPQIKDKRNIMLGKIHSHGVPAEGDSRAASVYFRMACPAAVSTRSADDGILAKSHVGKCRWSLYWIRHARQVSTFTGLQFRQIIQANEITLK